MRYLLVGVLAALIAVYGVAAFLTREHWAGNVRQDRTVVTFSARTPDGSPPAAEALDEARPIVEARVAALGIPGSQATVDGDGLTVTLTGDADDVRDIGRSGQLYVRPVIHAMATNAAPSSPSTPPKAPTADLAQRIADEKELRQSTDQQIQILGLQFQATRCGDDDVLAGNDDPELPLITCSSDGATVYLLGKSILDSAELESARALPDGVELSFDDTGTQVLADYTAANEGDQVALTVDTSVDAAPRIQQVISEGQVMITGDFTEEHARALASTLANGPLPVELTVASSDTETVAVERGWTLLRIWLAAAGLILAAMVVGVVWYLISSSGHRQPRL